MKILDMDFYNEKELISRLKTVQLKGKHSLPNYPDTPITVYPYAEAHIQLTKIRTEFLSLPQTYILQEQVEKIRELKWALAKYGLNLHELNGFLVITIEDDTRSEGKYTVTLMPAVVELSIEADGQPHFLINDGMHRIHDAHISSVIPQVILVSGASMPYYAYPMKGGFESVQMRNDLPPGFIKKWHRFKSPDYKNWFRDFNTAFENVGDQRGRIIKPGDKG